jgi:uncharacterized protein (DUF433 family)
LNLVEILYWVIKHAERIVIDKKIMHGKPVVKGTRVPVDIVVGSLAGGMTFEEIQEEYGIITEDIRACLAYAAELINSERVYPMAKYSEIADAEVSI